MNKLENIKDALTGKPLAKGGVMALGNFDGVHLGHQEVIKAAKNKAADLGVRTMAMSFHPHPYTLFSKNNVPFRLTPFPQKVPLLKGAGADDVVVIPFSHELAALDAEDFIQKILIESCDVRHVTVGFDYAFGRDRTGTAALLKAVLEPQGIGVTQIPPFRDENGEALSSTRIRTSIRKGEIPLANNMLGRPFTLQGCVLEGDKRGRQLGMPTANMEMDEYVRPLYGVYAGHARRLKDNTRWMTVINIGVRPTIGGAVELLEFHILDFDEMIYGETWDVELEHFMRREAKFPDLDALMAQMQADKEAARKLLA